MILRVRNHFKNLSSNLDKIPPGLVALYIFYVAAIVFMSGRTDLVGGDSPPTAYLPVSILRWGVLYLDPVIERVPMYFSMEEPPHYIVESDGHYYSKFSPVTSILALPVYAIFIPLIGTQPDRMLDYLRLSRFVSAGISILTILVIFYTLRRLVSQRTALWMALLYAFGTFTWASATNTLSTQSTSELFIALSLINLIKIGEKDQAGKPINGLLFTWTGLCMAVAASARYHTILPLFFLVLYLAPILLKRKSNLVHFIAGCLPIFGLIGMYNQATFGLPWSTGYGAEASDWATPLWVGMTGILFSPHHGLLIYSPILLIALSGAIIFWKKTSSAVLPPNLIRLMRWTTLACLAQLFLMSSWWAWHGGTAYNQRMLQEVHPAYMLLLAGTWAYLCREAAFKRILGLAAVWSIWMNIIRVTFYDQHLEWTEVYNPANEWMIRSMEMFQYIHWHGLLGFSREIVSNLANLFLLTAVATACFYYIIRRRLSSDGLPAKV